MVFPIFLLVPEAVWVNASFSFPWLVKASSGQYPFDWAAMLLCIFLWLALGCTGAVAHFGLRLRLVMVLLVAALPLGDPRPHQCPREPSSWEVCASPRLLYRPFFFGSRSREFCVQLSLLLRERHPRGEHAWLALANI